MESFEKRDFCRLHCVARKTQNTIDQYDNITDTYKRSRNIYDDVLTQDKCWNKLYIRLFWGGVDDNKIAKKRSRFIACFYIAIKRDDKNGF